MTKRSGGHVAQPDMASKLVLMAELGLGRIEIAALAEAFQIGSLSNDDDKFLRGPLVVHQSPWNETRPEWMAPQAMAERVAIVFGQMPGHIVGPTEIACVMYGASLDAPLGRDYSELYIWATAQAAAKHRDISVEQVYADLMGDEMPDIDPVFGHRARLKAVYYRLANDIKASVIRRAQSRTTRPSKSQDNTQAKCYTTSSSLPIKVGVQKDMFG